MSGLFSKPKMPPPVSAPAVNVDQSGLDEADALRRRAALNKQNSQTLFAGASGTPANPAQMAGGQPLKSLLG